MSLVVLLLLVVVCVAALAWQLAQAAAAQSPVELFWAKKAGSTNSGGYDDTIGAAVAVASDGSTYVTGHFAGVATFGQGTPQQQVDLTANGAQSAFLAKYASDGVTLAWAKMINTIGNETVSTGVAVASDGSAIVTGSFIGTTTFGLGAQQVSLTSAGSSDIFMAKYASDGTFKWVIQAGGVSDDVGNGVAVSSKDGSVVMAGLFFGNATFGVGAQQVVL
jgi:hypothetical protein